MLQEFTVPVETTGFNSATLTLLTNILTLHWK